MVDSTRAGEHTWGVEKRVREDQRAGTGLYGSFCSPRLLLLVSRNSIASRVISFIILRKEIRFNSHSRVVCNIPYTILNSIKFYRAAEFCVITLFSDFLTLDRFADHTILADSILYSKKADIYIYI